MPFVPLLVQQGAQSVRQRFAFSFLKLGQLIGSLFQNIQASMTSCNSLYATHTDDLQSFTSMMGFKKAKLRK